MSSSLCKSLLLAALALLLSGTVQAQPQTPECIAPASPGGGFDLTCKLAQSAFADSSLFSEPMRVTYMPGGVGAVAYNTIVSQRPADSGTLIAFSTGSLLNLALGKFGRFDEGAVRWLAAVGTSYGAIAVQADAPYKSLSDLAQALKANPDPIVIGLSGTIGSQDWIQTALLAKAIGLNPRKLHYVALEGGGEVATALLSGHIQVASTDISDSIPHLQSGKIRILAVFSEQRLDRPATASIPTAREQGYDIVWPVIRGYYLGPKVSDADYMWWKNTFDQLLSSEYFAQLRSQRGLFPFAMTGPRLQAHIHQEVIRYRAIAKDFDLIP